ncbi:MAG: helix-hairpin-helix domain-containing protein [Sulfolobales archaeon]|nr:helix-hairpin-helix domain-containing protein [Ignisphaera sp.]MCX8199765.1 helix-hairpin-helix domain-containing protein [Sulfolobales archaeon]MDW8084998.1 ERCC4 domain-containing protein [Ignisphaera sp.]
MVVVYVDEREKKSRVPGFLKSKGVTVLFKQLSVGDYVISNTIGIERKTVADFSKSLVDGRLFDQARRIAEAFEKPVMIIEGRFEDVQKFTRVHRNSVLGAYVSLGIGMNIIFVHSKDEEETAEIIKRIALYQQKVREKSFTPSRPALKDAKDDVREWQLFILQCFPHIGPKIARRIAEKFQTLRNFCNASISELSRIEGLSEKKAAEIYQIMNSPTTKFYEINRNKHIIDYIKKEEKSEDNITQ